MPKSLKTDNRIKLGMTTFIRYPIFAGETDKMMSYGSLNGKKVALFSTISKDGKTRIDSYREQTGVDSNGKPIYGKEYFREETRFLADSKTFGHFEKTTIDKRTKVQ